MFHGHSDSVSALAVDESRHVLASGSDDKTARLWDIRTHKVVKGFKGRDAVSSVALSSDGTGLVVCCRGDVLLYDLRQNALVVSQPSRQWHVSEDDISQVALGQRFMAIADDLGDVKILERTTGEHFKRLKSAHDNICSCVAFRPNRPWELISGGMDNRVIIWDFSKARRLRVVDMGEKLGKQSINPPFVNALGVSPSGHEVAAALGDGSIAVISLSKDMGSTNFLRDGHTYSASACMYIDSSLVISGGNDCRVLLWDPSKSSEPQWKQDLAANFKVNSLAWIPSTRQIAVAGSNNDIHLLHLL